MLVGLQSQLNNCFVRSTEDEYSLLGRDAIAIKDTIWPLGVNISYYLWGSNPSEEPPNLINLGGSEGDHLNVRKAFKEWMSHCSLLNFTETDLPHLATIKIAFWDEEGSGSYIGTDNLMFVHKDYQINFGGTGEVTYDTALHEIGHLIGLHHEHQNPNFKVTWNKPIIESVLCNPPYNWDLKDINRNIYQKKEKTEIEFDTAFDKHSIMNYAFEAGFICCPSEYNQSGIPLNNQLSDGDIHVVQKLYSRIPSANQPLVIQFEKKYSLELENKKQLDFIFTVPDYDYKVHKLGVFVKAQSTIFGLYITKQSSIDQCTKACWVNKSIELEYPFEPKETYIITYRLEESYGPDNLQLKIKSIV